MKELAENTQSAPRTPYVAPVMEQLGSWSTLTLQQTIPITDMMIYERELKQYKEY